MKIKTPHILTAALTAAALAFPFFSASADDHRERGHHHEEEHRGAGDHDDDEDDHDDDDEEEFELLEEDEIRAFIEKFAPEFVDDLEKMVKDSDEDDLEEIQFHLSEIIDEYHAISEEGGEKVADSFLDLVKAEWSLDKAVEDHQSSLSKDGKGNPKAVQKAVRNLLEKEITFEWMELEMTKKHLEEMEAEISERKDNFDAIVEEETEAILSELGEHDDHEHDDDDDHEHDDDDDDDDDDDECE